MWIWYAEDEEATPEWWSGKVDEVYRAPRGLRVRFDCDESRDLVLRADYERRLKLRTGGATTELMRPNHHRSLTLVGDPKVGDRVLKHFQGFGKFEGAIVATRDESTDDCEVIIYEVRYDDGDTEEYLRREVQELIRNHRRPERLDEDEEEKRFKIRYKFEHHRDVFIKAKGEIYDQIPYHCDGVKCICRGHHSKPVQRLDDDGKEVLEEFCSATMAAKKLGIQASGIFDVCCNKRLTTYGSKFRYKFDFHRGTNKKIVLQIDDKGKTIAEFESVGAASLSTGAGKHSIDRQRHVQS